jgi:transposase
MRKGIDGLAILVQSVLRQDPFSGHLFVFRGRTRANLIKITFWDRVLPVHQTARARCLSVAPERRARRDAVVDLGAVVVADRSRGLAHTGAAMATSGGATIKGMKRDVLEIRPGLSNF